MVKSKGGRVRFVEENYGGSALHWAMGKPELVRAMGDVSAVPTLFLFDADGRLVTSWLGAPPDLHQQVERELAALLTK